MLKFTITLYGPDEHTERNVAQALWTAVEQAHANLYPTIPVAMLIGEAKYEIVVDDPPVSGRQKQAA